MKRKLACLLALILMLSSGMAFAVVQPGDDFYYLDTANVLSEKAEGTIFFCNQLLEEACGAQIVVAALDSIGNEDIYDYAYDVFNEWGIGSAEENNGLLLVMTIQEDNYYALSGAGVDRILSGSVLQECLDEELEPDFAARDYEAGTLKFFEAVLDRYADYYNLNLSIQDGEEAYESYMESNSGAGSMGGAQGGGAGMDGPTSVWHGNEMEFVHELEHDFFDSIGSVVATVVEIIVLLAVLSFIFGRRRGGGFFFIPTFRPRPHHHYHHVHHRPPVHHHSAPRRSPPPRSGGFGGGAGRSSFGGGRSSGFGGARGGGGRSFGGGAGRGRR